MLCLNKNSDNFSDFFFKIMIFEILRFEIYSFAI